MVAPWVQRTSSAQICNSGLVSITASSDNTRFLLVCLESVFWASCRTMMRPLKTALAWSSRMPLYNSWLVPWGLTWSMEKYTEVSHYLQLVANRMGIDVDTLKVRGKEDSSLYSFGQFDPAH